MTSDSTLTRHPNEPNRAGYVAEIDPFDPSSMPKKHTALGRIKHENAEVVVGRDGKVAGFMGDDERGEFLYRFVFDGRYSAGGDNTDLPSSGTFYAARFHDDGTGEWLELTAESTGFASIDELCVHTRLAASSVGATTMDRPEWVASNPSAPEVYCALANNADRGIAPNAGGDPTRPEGRIRAKPTSTDGLLE